MCASFPAVHVLQLVEPGIAFAEPSGHREHSPLTDNDPLGQGRQNPPLCPYPALQTQVELDGSGELKVPQAVQADIGVLTVSYTLYLAFILDHSTITTLLSALTKSIAVSFIPGVVNVIVL